MLKKEVLKLLNEQIVKEFYSAYFYLNISCWYNAKNLNGFGNWFYVQAQEERDHAMLFLRYIENSNEEVTLDAVPVRDASFKDYAAPLTSALEHEQYVTASINAIYEAALAQKDYQTTQFLDWFLKEQAEEEKNTNDLVRRFELFGNDAKGLYLMDQELAARVYAPPTLVL